MISDAVIFRSITVDFFYYYIEISNILYIYLFPIM